MHFLDILEVLRLAVGQTSSKLLKKAFATWQHVFLSGHLCLGLCAEINSILFFCLSFFSFPYLFTAVIDPLLDLFPFWETIIETGDFCHGVQPLVYFAASFSIKFLSNIIVHISDSNESITWIWLSLERSFPPLELEYIRPCQFWFWWHQK